MRRLTHPYTTFDNSSVTEPKAKRSGGIVCLVVIGIAILLAITKPGREAHKEAIVRAFIEKHPITGVLTGPVAAAAVDYHSYVVCSTTTCGSEVITFGILDYVFLVASVE